MISNLGNVKSFKVDKVNGKIMKPYCSTKGYLQIDISLDGRKREHRVHLAVHRLVAMQFIDNINNLEQVNHIDGNKLNNNVTNLEWCTKEENQNHAVRTNLMQHGEDRPSAKLKESDVLEIYKLKGIMKASDIANKYGVSKNTINCILRGSKWKYLYKQYFKCETI